MLSVRRVGTRFFAAERGLVARGGKKIGPTPTDRREIHVNDVLRNRRPHVGPTRKLRATKSANTTTTTSAANYIALVYSIFATTARGHDCNRRHRQPTPLHAHTPPHAAIVAATITT